MEEKAQVRSTPENEPVKELKKNSNFTWTIENISQQSNKKKFYSNTFEFDGYKWRVLIYAKGNKVDYLSIYLAVDDHSALQIDWSRHARFSLAIVNQMNNKLTIKKDAEHEFNERNTSWGFTSFMPVGDLFDPSKGFLMNDRVIIQADVVVTKAGAKAKRKRNDTPSEKQTQSIEYGENLVGSRIKVWWSLDQTYYHGVVTSFNSMQKKHEILYDDGDIELLDLKTEKWLVSSYDSINPTLPEKVPSPQSDIIRVQGYEVKNITAIVLEAVFKKYGDIASDCVFKPASTRSSLLESMCEVITRIEKSDFSTIVSEMDELESLVSALEAAKINVSWLRALLEAIHKRRELKKNSVVLLETKRSAVMVKKAVEMDLKERGAALVDALEQFEKAEKCVKVLHLVEKKLSNNILEAKAENDSWVKRLL